MTTLTIGWTLDKYRKFTDFSYSDDRVNKVMQTFSQESSLENRIEQKESNIYDFSHFQSDLSISSV